MKESELFQKAFTTLHASDDTLQKVMLQTHTAKGTTGISKRFAALVTVLVILFSMTLVVHATGLLADFVAILTPSKDPGMVLDQAFGDDISTQKPNVFDAYGNPIEMPNMERPNDDLTEYEELLGAYISDLDGSFSVGENTFTLKSFLVDDTGSGMFTWTVENPNGISYGDAGYGAVFFAPMAPFDEPKLNHYTADGQKNSASMYTALISKNDAGTKLELVSYFGVYEEYQKGDSFVWTVSKKQEKQKIQITPAEHIPTKTMSTADGMQLTIANQGLTVNYNSNIEFVVEKAVIYFKDGTQYCLDDAAEIHNVNGLFWRTTEAYIYDELVYLFNRIIDKNEVASVELVGHWTESEFDGKDYVNTRHTEQYVFYP